MHNFSASDRILIIGGTGFIGSHLVRRCLKKSPFVSCIGLTGKADKGVLGKEVEYLQADIANTRQLQSVLKDRMFDYVFNVGGYVDHAPYFKGGRRMIEAHFIGLMNLLDCLDRKKLKGFVQIGSSDEYGSVPAPQNESLREMPIAPYSLAKASASHFIQMLHSTEGLPGVVVRLFLTYGPGQDKKRFLPQIIHAFLQNESVETTEGMQLRDFCYVEDVVEGLVGAAVTPQAKGRIINIASGVPVSIRKMIETVFNMIGKGKPLFGARPYRIGEHIELYADISVAKNILGWEPQTSLEEGLEKTIEYYRGNNGVGE
ncbi:MAG: NAD-dependent epimerase/dehydratase family protein [Candidatus Brocadiaceae bacterium]|nr:NAD-dependent epimerase/dehydratase family protein [Candidatus Brocadiaceae bacterium]